MVSKEASALRLITTEYENAKLPWFLGYSGGKDSSAVLKLVFQALSSARKHPFPITVLYCDTGVEIPVIRTYVMATLQRLTIEARRYKLPIVTRVLQPKLKDRYFVKVIGRGYPPPSNKFRWCALPT
jgi:DNA sulfur modification protein DndC